MAAEKENPKRKLLRNFGIKAVVLFVVWMILYYGFIIPDGRLNSYLTNSVIKGTTTGLGLLGYATHKEDNLVYINSEPVVLVADACNGLELFVLYIGFLLCFPGRWLYKIIFIPSGVFMIFIINVIREIVLSLNYKYFQQTFDFNHKYTYVFIVYLFVFGLWRFWLNRYSDLARKN